MSRRLFAGALGSLLVLSLSTANADLVRRKPAERVSLASGASVEVPAGAKSSPGSRDTEHVFVVAAGQTRLVIEEEPVSGECAAQLQEVWDGTAKAKGDETIRRLTRIDKLEWRKFGERKALYVEMASRTPAEADGDQGYHPMAMVALCDDAALLAVNVSEKSGTISDAGQKVLTSVLDSLQPSATKPAK